MTLTYGDRIKASALRKLQRGNTHLSPCEQLSIMTSEEREKMMEELEKSPEPEPLPEPTAEQNKTLEAYIDFVACLRISGLPKRNSEEFAAMTDDERLRLAFVPESGDILLKRLFVFLLFHAKNAIVTMKDLREFRLYLVFWVLRVQSSQRPFVQLVTEREVDAILASYIRKLKVDFDIGEGEDDTLGGQDHDE